MSFIIEEFKKYKVFLHSGNGNDVASIHLTVPSGKTVLRFAKGRLAKNSSRKSGGKVNYKVNIAADRFPHYVDILRNEKPLYFYFNNKTKLSYITSSDEPVGEGE